MNEITKKIQNEILDRIDETFMNGFNIYLYKYMTCDDKCAHYIEKPKTGYMNNEKLIRYSILYMSDEIEYKIDKSKLKNLLLDYLFMNDIRFHINIEYHIIPELGQKKDRTVIIIDILKK